MAAAATIGLLFSIVFHEMAHALVARHYGMPVRGITLFIFGGVAEMEQEPPSPKSELLMAIAGPLASFVLAGVFFLLLLVAGAFDAPPAVQGTLWYMWFINAVLAIFNLVPAFPLDGGRVLRAALWLWRGDLVAATRIAAEAGNFFGILLMVFGVFGVVTGDFVGGMWRFLIGLFLKGAADASYREVIARTALEGVLVAQVMTRDPISVTPDISVESFIEDFVYRYHHRVFPVTQNGVFLGCVGTEQAATIEREAWPRTLIAWIMQSCQPEDMITPGKDAMAALAQMRRTGRSRLWVVEGGRLVGVLSLRDMLELLATKLELEGNAHASRGMLRKIG
jgi:Zn-dependent protease